MILCLILITYPFPPTFPRDAPLMFPTGWWCCASSSPCTSSNSLRCRLRPSLLLVSFTSCNPPSAFTSSSKAPAHIRPAGGVGSDLPCGLYHSHHNVLPPPHMIHRPAVLRKLKCRHSFNQLEVSALASRCCWLILTFSFVSPPPPSVLHPSTTHDIQNGSAAQAEVSAHLRPAGGDCG